VITLTAKNGKHFMAIVKILEYGTSEKLIHLRHITVKIDSHVSNNLTCFVEYTVGNFTVIENAGNTSLQTPLAKSYI
jgi:hypothetical protein